MVIEEMEQFYLEDIFTILKPVEFKAIKGMQALILIMLRANVYPLEISLRE
jgi:hypothetical protein